MKQLTLSIIFIFYSPSIAMSPGFHHEPWWLVQKRKEVDRAAEETRKIQDKIAPPPKETAYILVTLKETSCRRPLIIDNVGYAGCFDLNNIPEIMNVLKRRMCLVMIKDIAEIYIDCKGGVFKAEKLRTELRDMVGSDVTIDWKHKGL